MINSHTPVDIKNWLLKNTDIHLILSTSALFWNANNAVQLKCSSIKVS